VRRFFFCETHNVECHFLEKTKDEKKTEKNYAKTYKANSETTIRKITDIEKRYTQTHTDVGAIPYENSQQEQYEYDWI